MQSSKQTGAPRLAIRYANSSVRRLAHGSEGEVKSRYGLSRRPHPHASKVAPCATLYLITGGPAVIMRRDRSHQGKATAINDNLLAASFHKSMA